MRISDWSSDVCSSDLGGEVAGESAGALGPWAVAAVHVERQANDEADDGLRGDELAQCFEIGGEFPAEDRLVGGREAPPCVAERHADRPGADVESRTAAAIGERCGEIGGGGGDQPRPLAVIASEAKQYPAGTGAQG